MPDLSSRPAAVLHPAAVRRAVVAVLAVGVAASASACTTSTPEAGNSAAPSATSAPAVDGTSAGPPSPTATRSEARPGTGGADPILRGKRQIVLRPVDSFESILALDAKGRLDLTDGDTDTSLFVLLPAGGKRYQIRTAKVREHGEPECMGLRDDGTAPTTVVAAPCDAGRAGQMFTISAAGETDEGRPAYTIAGQGGLHLRALDEEGLVAQRLGEGDAGKGTTFDFVDNGAAPPGPGE
ncbi:hypothetical protein [Micromonospora okii]|uniref:hypothetical protein n=1 Tax=Micromonospora okii TaxID=1182970 RepID=UPI001E4F60BD|nr:hypothetical protein [Micromonospora okii]